MSRKAQGNQSMATFAPIGPQIDNGFEMGGSRLYPFSMGMALQPPAYYSDYIGTGSGLPVSVPVGGLPDTIGAAGSEQVPSSAAVQAAAHPWGRTSPLPWVVAGLLAIYGVHILHYSERR